MNLFHIDTETTGSDHKKHEVFNLAFTIEIDGVPYCKMELFMRPEKWDTIDQKALDYSGWTIERLKRLPGAASQIKLFEYVLYHIDLRSAIQQKIQNPKLKIVEYGNRFDYRFLESMLSNHGSKLMNVNPLRYFDQQSINVLSLAKKKLPGLKSYKLKDVARRLGVPVDESRLHSAAYDRDLMIRVYNILKWR
jgi:DNA polymerase III epsilon subunit-like protein